MASSASTGIGGTLATTDDQELHVSASDCCTKNRESEFQENLVSSSSDGRTDFMSETTNRPEVFRTNSAGQTPPVNGNPEDAATDMKVSNDLNFSALGTNDLSSDATDCKIHAAENYCDVDARADNKCDIKKNSERSGDSNMKSNILGYGFEMIKVLARI